MREHKGQIPLVIHHNE